MYPYRYVASTKAILIETVLRGAWRDIIEVTTKKQHSTFSLHEAQASAGDSAGLVQYAWFWHGSTRSPGCTPVEGCGGGLLHGTSISQKQPVRDLLLNLKCSHQRAFNPVQGHQGKCKSVRGHHLHFRCLMYQILKSLCQPKLHSGKVDFQYVDGRKMKVRGLQQAHLLFECRVMLEEGFNQEVVQELRKRGHVVQPGVNGLQHTLFGKGQIIVRNPSDGVLWGGSDPRGDGQALGW